MNTDEIKIIQNLDKAAADSFTKISDIREKVWAKIDESCNIVEVDSFRYLAVACAVAAIILLFFSTDILISIQNTAAWELSESVDSIF